MHYAELELYKTMVVTQDQKMAKGELYTGMIDRGIVLDFIPTKEQSKVLRAAHKPLKLKTMFSLEERNNTDVSTLITKQITHYFITYGLGAGDVYDITFDGGKVITMTMIRGITVDELGDMFRKKLYTNAPVDKINLYKNLVKDYNFDYDLEKIKNNELRIMLYEPDTHTLNSGDDFVRYMIYKATDNTMLIKSRDVLESVSAKKSLFKNKFIKKNENAIAQVFNRHKAIILAAKGKHNRNSINRVSRLSKTMHKPVHEPVAKRFVSLYMSGVKVSVDQLSVRDKMKLLNVIEWHKGNFTTEMYQIRNGKTYTTEKQRGYETKKLQVLQNKILKSMKSDLRHLKGKNILLDNDVDYGLPISNKQTVGQLPFWTTVTIPQGKRISSGVYWKNSWGAHDLDLSAIDLYGNRSGWGSLRGYHGTEPKYSGDVTNARDGAMEFMTSKTASYANYVNIYSGNVGAECEIVVGTEGKNKWIKNPIARERIKLNSRQMIVGFTKENRFVFYTGRYGNSRISFSSNPVIDRMRCDMWTVKRLFDELDVKYTLDKQAESLYDYDMSYSGFSYDKLEKLMGI